MLGCQGLIDCRDTIVPVFSSPIATITFKLHALLLVFFPILLECNDREKASKDCPAGFVCMTVVGKRRSRLQCVPSRRRSGGRPGYTIPRDESRKSKE